MGKKLSEMTLEELWQLFPIFLTDRNPAWKDWYQEEAQFLQELLPQAERISHIGSTAIYGIRAKPIIDILLEVPAREHFSVMKDRLTSNGYICMHQDSRGLSLNKGYTENGFAEKVFHLHVRFSGDHDELYFRDYLNAHPDIAQKYEQLKLALWKEYEHDRDGYTAAKTEFVKQYTAEAKRAFSK